LLLEEPSDLLHIRMDADISLAELAATFLLGSSDAAPVTPLSGHLLQAFGEDQLPAAVAAYHSTASMSNSQQRAALDSAMQGIWDKLRALGIFDAYLSRVQETLLLVINEVVTPTPSTLSSAGPSNQQGS
jgi:hypothetical protein